MSFLNDEEVPPMPPVSMAMIEAVGEQLLEELQPEALERPTAIDLVEWTDLRLQRYGICVSPARASELGNRLGATDPVDHGGGVVDILVEEQHFEKLFYGGRQANQVRGTLFHEIGHVPLHVKVMRNRIKANNAFLLSRRMRRDQLKPFRDPEWQAWALGGCIAAPRSTIIMTGTLDPDELAEIYEISPGFMLSHLRRLKLVAKEEEGGAALR